MPFDPRQLSIFSCKEKLEEWVRSWWDEEQGPLTTLRPEGWFEEGQQDGNFLWLPPPACRGRGRRAAWRSAAQATTLSTSRWRKGLLKESDLESVVPVGSSVWAKQQHEPLLMFISFPLCCRHPSWSLRGTNYLESFRRELRGVWETMPGRGLFCANYSNTRGSFSPF